MGSQQMYLVEIFIDQISVLLAEGEESNKNLIIKIIFGPGVEFIVKENQLATSPNRDIVGEQDENGRRKWTKEIRVGKSYLFPSYPEIVIDHFRKYPLQMEVWNDDKKEENQIFVGIGRTEYDTAFTVYLKDTEGICEPHPSMSIKTNMTIYAECCCVIVGEITYIIRLSALGDNIVTDFQQILNDPENFVFRTDKAPSLFQCSRIEGEENKYVMSGGLYELAVAEGPYAVSSINKDIDICTELDSCGIRKGAECKSESVKLEKIIPDTIRMGDITGPCGNPSCTLAHKVKAYIRNMQTYKKATSDAIYGLKEADPTGKLCGRCSCKNDGHTEDPLPGPTSKCPRCGGVAQYNETCKDRLDKLYGTGVTPRGSRTHLINYMLGVTYENPELIKSLYDQNFIVGHNTIVRKRSCSCQKGVSDNKFANQNQSTKRDKSSQKNKSSSSQSQITGSSTPMSSEVYTDTISAIPRENIINIYNAELLTNKGRTINNFCTVIPDDKECKCNPPKPTAPCKTFDCECMTETQVKDTRKHHKQYCPRYIHKDNCPVTMLQDEEGAGEDEEEEFEVNLPYGLPPVQLGPCPVMGRPCTVPDGFARMYKIGALPNLPPSYGEAGKVCCSKEFERIKKAIKEYMVSHKDNDFRCLNRWYVDTETRCCDKEQRLLALIGKSCCGSHKLALNEKYAEEKKP
ncbi:uncharacterized protein LOC113240240 [Hyposmocoma kahamanoa]|uniref:uncharacterized protein LOC113240240 n=1 Tax=Hyposmocoma kahamanoa TaxID=1477025 RepID=UPI000E6D9AB8|nr:uncharacterized protein LOC113240240 [Hyposmocoma kahamanoa]